MLSGDWLAFRKELNKLGDRFFSKQRRYGVSTIAERVIRVIVEQLDIKPEEVTKEASFIDDLGADSLDTVELVMALEEEFGIEIPDDEAEKITRVKEAVDYIDKHG